MAKSRYRLPAEPPPRPGQLPRPRLTTSPCTGEDLGDNGAYGLCSTCWRYWQDLVNSPAGRYLWSGYDWHVASRLLRLHGEIEHRKGGTGVSREMRQLEDQLLLAEKALRRAGYDLVDEPAPEPRDSDDRYGHLRPGATG